MAYPCPKCGFTMYLDDDEQSLVCSNVACSHRDYRLSCPLLEERDTIKEIKSMPQERTSWSNKNYRQIVCIECGRTTHVVSNDESRCWECRTNRHVRKRNKKKSIQIEEAA